MKRFWLIGPVFALMLGGCGNETATQTTPIGRSAATATSSVPAESTAATAEQIAATAGLTVPDGFRVETVAQGLRGPTQMIIGPNGTLWVAQLAGGEGDGSGQVVALSPGGEQRVLLRDLDKPTGIAVLGGSLWIAAGRNLLRAPITGDIVGTPETVLADLPFNGRSNGTLTVTPDQKLVFETSGSRTGNVASEGSATLWILDPASPTAPQPLARGLKGAYAHTFDSAGRLWSTEIADDLVDGAAPPDEINQIEPGGDYGWPACFGPQTPARNFGGTEALCQATRPAFALLPPNSTPTGIAVAPWQPGTLLVALWNTDPGVVVQVSTTGTSAPTTFLSGLQRPQHLLIPGDGSLLVSDFASGTIYRVSAAP